jgi:hypothetical protein
VAFLLKPASPIPGGLGIILYHQDSQTDPPNDFRKMASERREHNRLDRGAANVTKFQHYDDAMLM